MQWPTENKQYNGQQKTNNTMANRKQTIQWPTENDNINKIFNRKQTIPWPTENKQYNGLFGCFFFDFCWPLYCLLSVGHCIVCFLLNIVVFWSFSVGQKKQHSTEN
jgi:hypothetical protein